MTLATCTGEDLLVASADKPFRFPATFTFVVRSFTVLDGIGKGLDPRFDISEIAAPYARGLLLEGNPQYAALAKDFRRRVGLQVTHACTLLLWFALFFQGEHINMIVTSSVCAPFFLRG